MKTQPIALDSIYPCSDNPNSHSESKIATLAANIREFGLISPITVKPSDKAKLPTDKGQRYEIIVGHRRYAAYRKLRTEAENQKWIEHWSSIPCVIVTDSSDYKDWGRRLSENKLRSFNWIAEAVSLASMRDGGKTSKEIAAIFGYTERRLFQLVAVGSFPGLSRMTTEDSSLVTLDETIQYLLPLRILPPREHDDKGHMLPVDYAQIDYSEVIACIDKLVSGDLRPENLGEYSAQRREEIAARQQEARLKDLAAREAEALKAQLTEKDKAFQKLQQDMAAEIKKAQAAATKEIEAEKVKTEQRIKDKTDELKQTLAALENAGTDKVELQTLIGHLEEEKGHLEAKLLEQAEDAQRLAAEIEADIQARVRAETIEQLRAEIQTTADKEAELQISEALKLSAEEMAKNDKERIRLQKYHENLTKREQALKEEQVRLEEAKKNQAVMLDVAGWIKEFNRRGEDFLEILEIANSNGYWDTMGKPELKRISGMLSGVMDQLRIVNNRFESKGRVENTEPPSNTPPDQPGSRRSGPKVEAAIQGGPPF